MKTTWLIICNATKACIFDITKVKTLQPETSFPELIETLIHPKGRMKGVDLVSDKPGHYGTQNGAGGKFISKAHPHEGELTAFAEEISKYLTHTQQENAYQKLIICAEPHFHGVLEKHLSHQVAKLVQEYIQKDYIPLPKNDLRAVIQEIQNRLH